MKSISYSNYTELTNIIYVAEENNLVVQKDWNIIPAPENEFDDQKIGRMVGIVEFTNEKEAFNIRLKL